MRDTSFYNTYIQNINNRQKQELNAIDSNLSNVVQPWVDLSKTASKIAFDEGERGQKRAEVRGKMKIHELQQFTPEQYKELRTNEEKFSKAHSEINAEAVKLRKQGVRYNVIDEIRKMSPWEKFGAAKEAAKLSGEMYGGWLENQLNNNETLEIDLTSEGGRKFKLNEIESAAELKSALADLREDYYLFSGLNEINPIIVDDNAWENIKKAEGALIKAKETDDRIKQGFVDTDKATVTFKNGGKYVDYLNALAATYDDKGKDRNYGDARKIAEKTLQALADDEDFSFGDFKDLVDRIADEVAPHMKKKYSEFDSQWIGSLYDMNEDAWTEIEDRKNEQRDQVYDSFENEWEDFAAENEITEADKKDFNDQVLKATGRNAEFLKDYETRQDRSDDQARDDLRDLEFLRGYLTKEDLLPYSDTIRTEFLDQVKKGEDLRKFDDKYTEKIEKLIDTSITESQGLNWFNKGGDLELEMKDIMEADIASMTRDLLTQYTPEQAYKQIKDHVRAKMNPDGKNLYLEEAKRAIKTTFDKGTTREFRKDLSKAMNALAYNPSQYDKLLVVDKEHLDQAEKYRDTAQEGDPVPQIYSMIAKEFPTLEAFDIMNGQLKAAGLKPVDKPQIEQDIDKAPDNLLRTLRCQPTQTGLARCHVEVQRLKGEDKNGYQMDWSNPEFLTPGIEY
jgi:hypothetical protein